MCNAISKCPLYGVTGCPLFRGCLSIEVNGRAVGTFRIVCYIMGVHYSGVSVKRGSTVENSESWQLVGGLSCQRSDHRATPPGNHPCSQTSSTTAGTDLFIKCQQRTID